ncbi:hypothetical protein O1611_g6311 [Lasiodiplodia mahajangana]|uniref:Uncharacterized protein n=1 Tax=Lasiodiplodia mahajangana TaxID=1108764 RepID=A0ACC2JIJ8_9PEZI|nr:hypothetical protein O1611_g6311 [Lasiodiplodia mahajangana]
MTSLSGVPAFYKLDREARANSGVDKSESGSGYWWSTSGQDLAKIMGISKYPDEAQHEFPSFFRDTISPQLGSRPDSNSGKSGVGWDGNPFEYSFELKGKSGTPPVRFVVDFTQLRPIDPQFPLSIISTQKVVDGLAKKTPGFDDTWYQSLVKWLTYPHLNSEEQKKLCQTVVWSWLKSTFRLASRPQSSKSPDGGLSDYYALGGRIPGLDEGKEKFRELVDLTSGEGGIKHDARPFTNVARKATVIYFSLSANNPYPATKINFYPANCARTDEAIVQGLDSWLRKYVLNTGGLAMEDRVKSVLRDDGHHDFPWDREERGSVEQGFEFTGLCNSRAVLESANLRRDTENWLPS